MDNGTIMNVQKLLLPCLYHDTYVRVHMKVERKWLTYVIPMLKIISKVSRDFFFFFIATDMKAILGENVIQTSGQKDASHYI